MSKLTLEERRRETLRRQLYGKEEASPQVSKKQDTRNKAENNKTFSMTDYSPSVTQSETLTTSYLTRDLTKVAIFSSLAIATQLSLYFLLQNNLVKLPF